MKHWRPSSVFSSSIHRQIRQSCGGERRLSRGGPESLRQGVSSFPKVTRTSPFSVRSVNFGSPLPRVTPPSQPRGSLISSKLPPEKTKSRSWRLLAEVDADVPVQVLQIGVLGELLHVEQQVAVLGRNRRAAERFGPDGDIPVFTAEIELAADLPGDDGDVAVVRLDVLLPVISSASITMSPFVQVIVQRAESFSAVT